MGEGKTHKFTIFPLRGIINYWQKREQRNKGKERNNIIFLGCRGGVTRFGVIKGYLRFWGKEFNGGPKRTDLQLGRV